MISLAEVWDDRTEISRIEKELDATGDHLPSRPEFIYPRIFSPFVSQFKDAETRAHASLDTMQLGLNALIVRKQRGTWPSQHDVALVAKVKPTDPFSGSDYRYL